MEKLTTVRSRTGLRGKIVDYLLENHTGTRASRTDLAGPDRNHSYGDISARVARVANALRSLGVSPVNACCLVSSMTSTSRLYFSER